MNHRYTDILDRIPEPPTWWDEHAVPRYCEFSPRANANIYADEVVLLLIACQACGTEYRVCMSQSVTDRWFGAKPGESWPMLSELVETGALHYGDPPNNCPESCAAGATMNSVPVRVLEFWRRSTEKVGERERVPELEREAWPDWMPRGEARA